MSKRRKRRKNRIDGSMLAITFVAVILLGFLVTQSFGMRKKLAAYEERVAVLKVEIEEEQSRTDDIERLRDYMKTDAYIEEIAREKLKYVKANEIVFIEEE